MSKDNGGPAFPVAEVFDERRVEVTQYGSAGMTLRDYFAAKAMQGMLYERIKIEGDATVSNLARDCYRMADAMLAERAK